MSSFCLLVYVLLGVALGTAHAEVVDKVPSLPQNIAWGVASSTLCFLVARVKPWLLLAVVPWPAFYFWVLVSEIHDPFVGSAIRQEMGGLYVYSSYGLCLLVLASVLAGIWWHTLNNHVTNND